MNDDIYSYLRKLHTFIEGQERKIQILEKQVQDCMEEIQKLKEKPSINVEKIEYKFDQLKVEKLDGTLNIGLSPSELQGIDDFTVDNQMINTGLPPNEKMRMIIEIEDAVLSGLDKNLKQMVSSAEQSLQRSFDPSYADFIKNDIKRQLSDRINFYLNQVPPTVRSAQQLKEEQLKIIDQLRIEIEKGIYTFLSSLPEN